MISAASWTASTEGIFILGTLLIIFLGLITTVGAKIMFRLNDILFILGITCITGMVIDVASLAFSSNTDFIAHFNLLMSQYTGSPDSYQWSWIRRLKSD